MVSMMLPPWCYPSTWHTLVFMILTSDSRFENEVMGYAPIYDRTYLVIVFGPSSPECSFSEPKRANLTSDYGNDRLDERVESWLALLMLGLEKNPKQNPASHGRQHEPVFAGNIGRNLDGFEELPLGIVDGDHTAVPFCSPPCMAGRFSC
jgi:hypothetical protein